jgi:hypothetical protein
MSKHWSVEKSLSPQPVTNSVIRGSDLFNELLVVIPFESISWAGKSRCSAGGPIKCVDSVRD